MDAAHKLAAQRGMTVYTRVGHEGKWLEARSPFEAAKMVADFTYRYTRLVEVGPDTWQAYDGEKPSGKPIAIVVRTRGLYAPGGNK